MKHFILAPVLVSGFLALQSIGARADEPESKEYDSYKVIYEQDFDGDGVLEDFQFSDPKAWKTGTSRCGRYSGYH